MNQSNHSILVVDDNADLRKVVTRTLVQSGYRVTEAADGRAAQALLEGEDQFDAIVADIRMPGLNGLDLLYYVKQNWEIPFIIITAFSELLETKTAYEIGADGFLCKPFHSEELKSVLAVALHLNVAPEPKDLDGEYFEVDIKDVTRGTPLEVDLFLRLSPTKYVKVASAGALLDDARVDSYVKKGVSTLHFKKD